MYNSGAGVILIEQSIYRHTDTMCVKVEHRI